MGTNHGDFSGNAQAFSGVRLGDAKNAMGLTDQFTRAMNQTMTDIMPKWPDTMNATGAGAAAGQPPQFQFSVVINGQTCGPYDLNALSQMAAQGQLTAQSPVWRQGMTGWQAAGTVPELAGLFAQGGTPAAIPSPPVPVL